MRPTLHYPDVGGMYGIKRYTVQLAKGLEELGHQPRLHKRFHRELRFGRMRIGGMVTVTLAQYLPVPGDLVHATTFHVNPRLRPADVVTVHDVMPLSHPHLYALSSRELAHIRKQVARSLQHGHVVTDTEHGRREILRLFPEADPTRVHAIHLGIDAQAFHPGKPVASKSHPWKTGKLNLLVAMNWELRKRVDLLFEAARELPFIHLVQVGSDQPRGMHGPMRDRCQRLAGPLVGQGRYTHLGAVGDAELRDLYAGADLVVHPSEAEGFGLPPLEALACGARVLASDIPPHREILGAAGDFVALDAAALTAALRRAWSSGEFGAGTGRGAAHAVSFTWRRTAERTVAVYRAAKPAMVEQT
ncbi:MAG TPA: glycosyltransferase family 1 protein [Candidatus Thermoplasmatota archaeon]|nr:glycosyltransferase family 1 protein [Candidatus Thermoplasmatota archaeon]